MGFGNGTRIDYGSGHELAFIAWLCCLSGIGYLEANDETAIVMRIFTR
jgi:serine/threonine-protein phosphatase 2A activator